MLNKMESVTFLAKENWPFHKVMSIKGMLA